MDPKKVAYIMD
jgi:hypothetical protein